MTLSTLIFTTLFIWSQTPPPPPTVVFLGDSLTEGYGLTKEKAFPALIEKSLLDKKIPVKVINAGISGSTSASAESRLRWQLKQKPQILVLALGANDGLRGLSTESLSKNLESTIKVAQDNKVQVILAGMKIPLNYGEDYRKKYEEVFSSLAKKYQLPFIPFLLKDVGGVANLNISDGIHPNEKGHQKIAETVQPAIEKALKETHAR